MKAFEDLQYYSKYAYYPSKVLEVLIPKGTKIRRASSFFNYTVLGRNVILTEELTPINVLKGKD